METVISDGLVGIDPDDTQDVKVGGATFTVGTIPAGIWESLTARRSIAKQEAEQRCLQVLIKAGVNAAEKVDEDDKPVPAEVLANAPKDKFFWSRLDRAVADDPTFRASLTSISGEAARYAVRAHKDFYLRSKGERKPVPLEFEEVTHDGVKVQRLAESSFRVYRVNAAIITQVWNALYSLNTLGGEAKKV